MKTCPYCGNKLEDEMKWCFSCGKQQPELQMPQPTPPKKSKKGPIIAAIMAIIAIIAIIATIVVVFVLKGNDSSDDSENDKSSGKKESSIASMPKVSDIKDDSNDTYLGAFKIYFDSIIDEDYDKYCSVTSYDIYNWGGDEDEFEALSQDIEFIKDSHYTHKTGSKEDLKKMQREVGVVYDDDGEKSELKLDDCAIVTMESDLCGIVLCNEVWMVEIDSEWYVLETHDAEIKDASFERIEAGDSYEETWEMFVDSINDEDYAKMASMWNDLRLASDEEYAWLYVALMLGLDLEDGFDPEVTKTSEYSRDEFTDEWDRELDEDAENVVVLTTEIYWKDDNETETTFVVLVEIDGKWYIEFLM